MGKPKTFDAYVMVKHRISSICDAADLAGGLRFDDLVRDLIDSEGLCGLTDEYEIVSVEQRERDE